MDNQIEELKKKIDIVEFIGSYITLKKTGRNFKANCPFHQEKTPSFVISPERQIWHCFGACQEGGDAIKFLMKWENITFVEALNELAKKYGVKLRQVDFEDKVWQKKERLFSLNLLAGEFFTHVLYKTKFGEKAVDYLKSRQIKTPVAKKFGLGYAPSSWDSLMNFLRKRKYSIDEIYEAGLVVRNERGSFYDRFRGRLVFPLRDVRGNVLGFSGRMIEGTDKSAKYINTPETPIYHKRETLFGIDLAKEAIKKEKNIILVEGEFDVISPYQEGIENIVAIKGSAVTREQLLFIKRYTNKVNLSLDSDNAGEEAVKRAIEEAEVLDFDLGVYTFDFGKDPDEALKNDPVKFKKILKNPTPVYDFIIDFFEKKYPGNDSYSKKSLGEEAGKFLMNIRNPIVESYYYKKLAGILDVGENSIQRLIAGLRRAKTARKVYDHDKAGSKEIPRDLFLQKYFISTVFQKSDPYKITDQVFKILEITDFTVPAYQKIFGYFFDYQKKHPVKFELDGFIDTLPAELKPVFDEAYLFSSVDFGLEMINFDKLVFEIKRFSLKNKIKDLLAKETDLSSDEEKKISIYNLSLKELEKSNIKL